LAVRGLGEVLTEMKKRKFEGRRWEVQVERKVRALIVVLVLAVVVPRV
jgi:hypothetical protein